MMKNKITIIVLILLTINLNAQDNEFISTPYEFRKQCKASFIAKINNGEKKVSELTFPTSKKDKEDKWVVFSDRKDNEVYRRFNNTMTTNISLTFLQPLYVKGYKENRLQVCSYPDGEVLGWVESNNLLLSTYSLTTEGMDHDKDLTIPKKAIILTPIGSLGSDTVNVRKNRKFYSMPGTDPRYIEDIAKQFRILFVYKEQEGSVLLGTSDHLTGDFEHIFGIEGWMPKVNKTDWDTRVALEPSRDAKAITAYGNNFLYGYKDIKKLERCRTTSNCDLENWKMKFKVGPIDNNQMRSPILNSPGSKLANGIQLDDETYQVISIEGNQNSGKKGSWNKDREKRFNDLLNINIIFVIDATKSMKNYFESVTTSIQEIIEKNKLVKNKLKFGLILYRDYKDDKDKKYGGAFEVMPLLPAESANKIQQKLTSTVSKGKCNSVDQGTGSDPEALYNALINGIPQLNIMPEQSNVVVLIGDCGNYQKDKNGYTLDRVVETFDEYQINLISYQVKFNNQNITYKKFNRDAYNLIDLTAKKRLFNDKLTAELEEGDNLKDRKWTLTFNQEKDAFQPMFGRFIYAGTNKMKTADLTRSINETVQNFNNQVKRSLKDLLKGGGRLVDRGGVKVNEPSPGSINEVMRTMECTKEEAIKILNEEDHTTELFISKKYLGKQQDAFTPVIYMTQHERENLRGSLRILNNDKKCKKNKQKKECFQNAIRDVCISIIGQGADESKVMHKSINDIWLLIFNVDFEGHKILKDRKLKDLKNVNNKVFQPFYEEFKRKANAFLKDSYYVEGDSKATRKFTIYGEPYYWIPLADLPGMKELN